MINQFDMQLSTNGTFKQASPTMDSYTDYKKMINRLQTALQATFIVNQDGSAWKPMSNLLLEFKAKLLITINGCMFMMSQRPFIKVQLRKHFFLLAKDKASTRVVNDP